MSYDTDNLNDIPTETPLMNGESNTKITRVTEHTGKTGSVGYMITHSITDKTVKLDSGSESDNYGFSVTDYISKEAPESDDFKQMRLKKIKQYADASGYQGSSISEFLQSITFLEGKEMLATIRASKKGNNQINKVSKKTSNPF